MLTTISTSNALATLETVLTLNEINGSSIIGIKNYTNSQNEISNQSIFLATPLQNTLQKDYNQFITAEYKRELGFELMGKTYTLNKREKGKFYTVKQTATLQDIETVYNKVKDSLEARLESKKAKLKLIQKSNSGASLTKDETEKLKTIKKSEAQKNAYTHITNGLKYKDNILYVQGKVRTKTVLKKGEYKIVCSSLATLLRRDIEKKMRMSKFKTFKLNLDETLVVRNKTIVRHIEDF